MGMERISKFQTGHELAIRDHCGVGGGARTGAKCALQLGTDQKMRTKKEKIPLSKHLYTQLTIILIKCQYKFVTVRAIS